MIIVNPDIRVGQYRDRKHFWVYNPKNGMSEHVINKSVFNVIRIVNDKKANTFERIGKIIDKDVIITLIDSGILIESDIYQKNNNILPASDLEFPLQAVTIEVINTCNLNCIHCYGKFGHPTDKHIISFAEVQKLKDELDKLNTLDVRISGGECFLNLEITDIVRFLLVNGFRISIYTNGFFTKKIIEMVMQLKEYHFFIGLSLDGTEDIHNLIRGNSKSYENVINTLTALEQYQNIDLLIAVAIMKQNIHFLKEIHDFIDMRFPNINREFFIACPVNGTDFALDTNTFDFHTAICKELFSGYIIKKTESNHIKKKHRCRGGVDHAVISGDGTVRMCPIAVEEEFVLGNLKSNSLFEIWTNPQGNIPYFRREYQHKTPQCKKCLNKKICGSMNCRIEALRLTGNSQNASPITCHIVSNIEIG